MKPYLGDEKPEIDFEEYGNEKELYIKNTFKKYSVIESQFRSLLQIPIYFSSKDSVVTLQQEGISEIEYYKYHFENFIIRTVTLLDLCGKLGLHIFRVNLKEKDSSYYKFATNPQTKDSEPVKILNYLNKVLSEKVQERHLIIHKGGHQSEEIKSIDSSIFSTEIIKIDQILQDWFNKEKERKIEDVIKYMYENISMTMDYIFKFLDLLLTEFEKNIV